MLRKRPVTVSFPAVLWALCQPLCNLGKRYISLCGFDENMEILHNAFCPLVYVECMLDTGTRQRADNTVSSGYLFFRILPSLRKWKLMKNDLTLLQSYLSVWFFLARFQNIDFVIILLPPPSLLWRWIKSFWCCYKHRFQSNRIKQQKASAVVRTLSLMQRDVIRKVGKEKQLLLTSLDFDGILPDLWTLVKCHMWNFNSCTNFDRAPSTSWSGLSL